MGMYDTFRDIYNLFYNDETLNRLLYYPPQDYIENRPDPLDESLNNVLDIDEFGEIRNDRIMTTNKSSDLEKKKLCRLYLYAGRRKPNNSSFLVADQQVTVDILCHSDFEIDLRLARISDRINELLVSQRVVGIGKVKYIDGRPIGCPQDYVAFQHVYQIGNGSK